MIAAFGCTVEILKKIHYTMLEALCNNKPIRASKDLKGKGLVFRCKDEQCEHPELELVAGNYRRAYFRHQRRGKCTCPDGETDWHLEWKSHFDQIEVDMGFDEATGERNRADAVVGNLVLEFQHSPIKDEEKGARERFYGSKGGMLWIVDASNKRNLQRYDRMVRKEEFLRAIHGQPFDSNYIKVMFPDEALPQTWWMRTCGIVFDYGAGRKLIYKLPQSPRSLDIICREFEKEELIAALRQDSKYFTKSPQNLRTEYLTEIQNKINESNARKAKAATEARAAAKAEQRRKLAESNARAIEFMRLAKEAQLRAISKQQGKGRDQAHLEPIGNTGFLITAWGDLGIIDERRHFVLATPIFK